MQTYFRQYPAFLLLSTLVYSAIVGMTPAGSIAILGLCALSAYRAYLDRIEAPDPAKPLKKEIDILRSIINTQRDDLAKVRDDFSKVAFSLNRSTQSGSQFKF